MVKNKNYGGHYLVELGGCNPQKLKFVKDVKKALITSARKSKATILKSYFYQFKPEGVSGIIMIAESHFSIHTWPEDGFVAFDVLTCGKMYPELAIKELKKILSAKKIRVRKFKRGFNG